MNCDEILSELKAERDSLDRVIAALEPLNGKRKKHWTQTKEGRALLSRAMKVLTMRSSSEWKLITARRPPGARRSTACGVKRSW